VGCGGGDGGGSAELGIPVPWIRAAAPEGGRILQIGYETDPCTKARRARVDLGERTVTVTLGDPERDPKKACIGIVRRHCALVRLDEPAGTRKIVDGAPGPRRRNPDVPIERFGACRPVEVVG
jgi:hypothetical protein